MKRSATRYGLYVLELDLSLSWNYTIWPLCQKRDLKDQTVVSLYMSRVTKPSEPFSEAAKGLDEYLLPDTVPRLFRLAFNLRKGKYFPRLSHSDARFSSLSVFKFVNHWYVAINLWNSNVVLLCSMLARYCRKRMCLPPLVTGHHPLQLPPQIVPFFKLLFVLVIMQSLFPYCMSFQSQHRDCFSKWALLNQTFDWII